MQTALIAVGLLVAVLVPVGVVVFVNIKRTQEQAQAWRPVPGHVGTLCINYSKDVSLETLGVRLTQAIACIEKYTQYKPPAMAVIEPKLRILISATNEWKDSSGQKVGGQEWYYTVSIGPDLSALAHEVAHVCEFVVLGVADETHQTWASNGTTEADNAYRALALQAVPVAST